MIDDILKSTKEQLLERISSPIIGSFVVAWSLWNYKFFVILFSATSVTQTFDLIHKIVFPTYLDLLGRGFLFPALTAAAYIFLYPYPALYVFKYTKERQKEQNAVRQQIENETLLSKEESWKIYAEIRKADSAHREEVDRLNKEIERLKEETTHIPTPPISEGGISMAQLQNDMAQMKKIAIASLTEDSANKAESKTEISATDPDTKITPSQLHLMQMLESSGGEIWQKNFLQMSDLSKIQTEYDLEELINLGLIKRKHSPSNGDYKISFLQEGRRILLKENERVAHATF